MTRSFFVGANVGTGISVLLLFIAYPLGHLVWKERVLLRNSPCGGTGVEPG